MSLIHCTCGCVYQKDGYCKLEKAAEITAGLNNEENCLHFKARDVQHGSGEETGGKSPQILG